MTKPDSSFALFTNGSLFSLDVCDCLAAVHLRPSLIALPQYAPAQVAPQAAFQLESDSAADLLVNRFADVERVYAPARDNRALLVQLRLNPVDFILVACWPYLIKAEVFAIARKAAFNLHPSMLPAYRGRDPLEQQITARENEFGVSLHRLSLQFDQGEVVGQRGFQPDGAELDRRRLEKRCARLGVDLFLAALEPAKSEIPLTQ